MEIVRGDIWWADLPEPQGSQPGYRRPIVVISANRFNRSGIRTLVVASVTSNLRIGSAPGTVTLTPAQSGLGRVSVINLTQLLTIDKSWLVEFVGRPPADKAREIDEELRRVLSL